MLEPGINLPSIMWTPDTPALFAKVVTGVAGGLMIGGTDNDCRNISGYRHAMLFPSWSSGTIGFYAVPEGETVQVRATGHNELTVVSGAGDARFTDQVLVIYHADLGDEVVREHYASDVMRARAHEDWAYLERLEQS